MRTSPPGPPGQAAPLPWRRWLLPLGGTAGVLALLALVRGAPRRPRDSRPPAAQQEGRSK